MASSMLTAAAAAMQEKLATAASAEEDAFMDAASTKHDDDEIASSLHTCANDPDFAVICTFLQKFSKDLGLDMPNFNTLQEWLTNTDELAPKLRELHIKLLRKTRKTVHEKSWESALSKFCFTYSAQDAWEVERFGYKKSSLKVKLRIFRELLESQFERNAKFRSKILTFSADSLRAQPIGRDRLGHSYWFTQDEECNIRIYQEHLDEEIWQVVATNRDEFVNLITRLRGNEVVLPSADIGVIDEDTSSSNSCTAPIAKQPPPEERDDSQEEEAKVPNLRIKLNNSNSKVIREESEESEVDTKEKSTKHNEDSKKAEERKQKSEEDSPEEPDKCSPNKKLNKKPDETQRKVKPLLISQSKIASPPNGNSSKKRNLDEVERSSPTRDDLVLKKSRPTLLDSKRAMKPSKYENTKSEDDDEDDEDLDGEEEEDENSDNDEEDEDMDEECEEEDIDSAAADEDETEDKDIEDDDDEDEVGEAIEDPPLVVRGSGSGKNCDAPNPAMALIDFASDFFDDSDAEFGDVIEEPVRYVHGVGEGSECLVGATKNDTAPESSVSSTAAASSTHRTAEPKATFFFGEPGCLKLSPMKQKAQDEAKLQLEKEKTAQEEKEKESPVEEVADNAVVVHGKSDGIASEPKIDDEKVLDEQEKGENEKAENPKDNGNDIEKFDEDTAEKPKTNGENACEEKMEESVRKTVGKQEENKKADEDEVEDAKLEEKEHAINDDSKEQDKVEAMEETVQEKIEADEVKVESKEETTENMEEQIETEEENNEGQRDKPEVKDDKPEPKDDKSEAKDDKPEAKDDESEAKDDKTEAKDDESEAKDDKPEAKDDESEAKDDKTEAKDDESEPKDDKPEPKDDKSEAKDDKPEAKDDESEAKDDKSEAKDEKPEAKDDKPEAKDEKPEAKDEKPEAKDDKPDAKEDMPEEKDEPLAEMVETKEETEEDSKDESLDVHNKNDEANPLKDDLKEDEASVEEKQDEIEKQIQPVEEHPIPDDPVELRNENTELNTIELATKVEPDETKEITSNDNLDKKADNITEGDTENDNEAQEDEVRSADKGEPQDSKEKTAETEKADFEVNCHQSKESDKEEEEVMENAVDVDKPPEEAEKQEEPQKSPNEQKEVADSLVEVPAVESSTLLEVKDEEPRSKSTVVPKKEENIAEMTTPAENLKSPAEIADQITQNVLTEMPKPIEQNKNELPDDCSAVKPPIAEAEVKIVGNEKGDTDENEVVEKVPAHTEVTKDETNIGHKPEEAAKTNNEAVEEIKKATEVVVDNTGNTREKEKTPPVSNDNTDLSNEPTNVCRGSTDLASAIPDTPVKAASPPREETPVHTPALLPAEPATPLNDTPKPFAVRPATETPKSAVPNRKRRLDDFEHPSHAAPRHSTSESDMDNSEMLDDGAPEDDCDDMDVGGKRFKMRPKLTNVEIRKKVEAQKGAAAAEDTSSSEEEARRRRKIITPKRQIDRSTLRSPKLLTSPGEECRPAEKSPPKVSLADAKPAKPLPAAQLNTPTVFTATTITSTVTPVATPQPVKQKPTLADIIEKKLKKTPEKLAATSHEPLQGSTTPVASSSVLLTPPKKSPITKPLKKNLLTQIRQGESDEEAVPRKRAISETTADAVAVGSPPKSADTSTANAKSDPQVFSASRVTPDRKTPERHRKRRSSEEPMAAQVLQPEEKKDCLEEKIMKSSNDFQLRAELLLPKETPKIACPNEAPPPTPPVVIKDETKKESTPPPPDTNDTETTGNRRSGRRGGASVVYAELPQPKRTRGGAVKGAPIKKEELLSKGEEKVDTKQEEDEDVKGDDESPTKKDKESPPSKRQQRIASVDEKPEETDQAKVNGKKKDVKAEEQDIPVEEAKEEPEKPKATTTPSSTTTSPKAATATPARGGRGARKKKEVDTTNIIESTDETPVRQSRRIALQKIREEAERRKLEEIALRSMKEELKKKKKAEKEADPTVLAPSEHSSSDEDEEEEESEVEKKRKTKKKCPGKDGAWSSGSEEQDDPEEVDEEPPHEYSDPGSPLFRSDHEFSPESELEDESQVVPMKRARTARKEDAEDGDDRAGVEEEDCQKCGKSDHPEWILLCDSCDKGYHCSCLSPVLFYIPEGNWYCPPCQQAQLIAALEKQLQEFDDLVEQKRLNEEEEKRLAEEAERAEIERLENEKLRKEQKKLKGKRRGGPRHSSDSDSDDNDDDEDDDDDGRKKSTNRGESEEDDDDDEKSLARKSSSDKGKRRRGDGRSRRRTAARSSRQRRRQRSGSESNQVSGSSDGDSKSASSSSSSATDSDDEPIYKLRKRRQINVSYRLNEYDDLINSALKKEMDEVAGAGNLGRGKDITTIIEADKEEKARLKQLVDDDESETEVKEEKPPVPEKQPALEKKSPKDESDEQEDDEDDEAAKKEKPETKKKSRPKPTLKKKPRKLTTLDISSEEDDASDEDFKTSSFEDDDEDTSVSVSSNSDSSLEIYRRRSKKGKRGQRKASRRAARERRKDRRFVVEESDDDEEEDPRPKSKKKRKDDSDYTESETGDDDDDQSELSENVDSADLCDDTTSEESDGAWCPSKRKKQRKSNTQAAKKSPKLKKPAVKKPKRVEYSDDDISESEEEEEDEDDDGANGTSGKGSGKQPRSQPLKSNASASHKSGKGKGKGKTGAPSAAGASKKKKKKPSEEEDSFSDSDDSTRKTRGRRYAYLDDFDEDSSDGGIKPGVKRPDTPPEERQKFIQRQEEIKRMLAEKNAEGAKLAATPRLTPIKGAGEKDKRSPAKPGDSLSTVPLSVIRQAKVLDIDYLQRKGEPVGELENVDEVDSEFDDADLPDDFPEDMDEDTIARMVEEDEEFVATAAARELPPADEVMRTPNKAKPKEPEKHLPNPSLMALSQMPGATTPASGLQEPVRKRLPMPTMHPPILRQPFPAIAHGSLAQAHLLQRHNIAPSPSHLLQSALSAPMANRNFGGQQAAADPLQRMAGIAQGHMLAPPHIMPVRQQLPPSAQQPPLAGPTNSTATEAPTPEAVEPKPRGRRKKITPLRDPLQKQQTAAAVTAATSTHSTNSVDKAEGAPATATATGATTTTTPSQSSVIKTASSVAPPLAAAHLYKPGGAAGGPEQPPPQQQQQQQQPSVITRMPHIPPPQGVRAGVPPPSAIYPNPDVAIYYGAPQQGSRSAPNPSALRHRGAHPLTMGVLPPHPGMRQTYGPPPPLRGSQPPGQLRSPYAPQTQGEHMPVVYGAPPPARHSSPHLNPYRPPTIYGNPNFVPRVTPPGLRPGAAPDYPGGTRYPPYGYYPPPPPLTAPHQQAPGPPGHSTAPPTHPTAAPSSVIVTAPHAAASGASATTTNHSVSTITRSPPSAKSTSPHTSTAYATKSLVAAESRSKKLTTLEAYPIDATKSPLANFAGESSGSRSSPGGMHGDGGDDSSSVPANLATSAGTATAGGEGQASEFSGLVSYFSSQHDDYNT